MTEVIRCPSWNCDSTGLRCGAVGSFPDSSRVKFSSEVADVPDRVLAKLGGWETPRTLGIYQQRGVDVLLEALDQRWALRELLRGGRTFERPRDRAP